MRQESGQGGERDPDIGDSHPDRAEAGEAGSGASEAGAAALARVLDTVRTMVSPGGCAWHAAQTHESLTRYLVEETAEFIDAVERGLPADEVRSELGDVLYQVLFHAAIAERDGEGYDLAAVAGALDEKLVARHPHVFGDRGYMSVEELNAEWERLKEDAVGEDRGSRGPLDGIPAGMPTLARAAKVVDRLRRAGLLEAGASYTSELRACVDSGPGAEERRPDSGERRPSAEENPLDPDENPPGDTSAISADPEERGCGEEGIGDAMLALVMRAHADGVDPDRALRRSIDRFTDRIVPR
ncbi:MAG: MazG nucleotide pyrophosphohydrolase domain-containing protein [Leucobacter sp.]